MRTRPVWLTMLAFAAGGAASAAFAQAPAAAKPRFARSTRELIEINTTPLGGQLHQGRRGACAPACWRRAFRPPTRRSWFPRIARRTAR